ncbi:MAG: hypothetical protein RL260_3477, partial [Pseudomonadota bacterium]
MTQPDDTPSPAPTPAPAPETVHAPAATAVPAVASRGPFDHVMEQFARDYLRDRRSTRRWSLFFRIGWLGLGLFAAWTIYSENR